MKNTNKTIFYIFILAILFCVFLLLNSEYNENIFCNFLYNFSIAIITSTLFYFFIVFIPEQKRRSVIKINFEEQYILFKKDCIYLFLSALGEASNEKLWEKLCDLKEFKKYFKEKYQSHPDKWNAVWANMDDFLLEELLIQLGLFKDEIHFVLYNTDIYDKRVLSFFKLLSQHVYKFYLRGINLENDTKKELFRFLWELFSGWNFYEGYKNEDIVKIMIDKI